MGVHIIMISNRYAHSYEQVLTHTYRQVPTYLGTNMNSHYLGTNTLCLCSLSLSHRHSFNVSLFHYQNTHSLPQKPTISSYLTNHFLSLSIIYLQTYIVSLINEHTQSLSLNHLPTNIYMASLPILQSLSLSIIYLQTQVHSLSLSLTHMIQINECRQSPPTC